MKIEVNIPDSRKGDWEISTFEITKKDADFENIKDAIKFLKGLKRGEFPHICPPRSRMFIK